MMWFSIGAGIIALVFFVVALYFLWKVRKDLDVRVGIVSIGRSGYYDDPRTFADDAHAGWEEPPPVP